MSLSNGPGTAEPNQGAAHHIELRASQIPDVSQLSIGDGEWMGGCSGVVAKAAPLPRSPACMGKDGGPARSAAVSSCLLVHVEEAAHGTTRWVSSRLTYRTCSSQPITLSGYDPMETQHSVCIFGGQRWTLSVAG